MDAKPNTQLAILASDLYLNQEGTKVSILATYT